MNDLIKIALFKFMEFKRKQRMLKKKIRRIEDTFLNNVMMKE